MRFLVPFMCGLAVWGLAPLSARADIPPPDDYVEQCTVEIQSKKTGSECKSCRASHLERDKCKEEFEGTELKKVCSTYGASVWTEVWCGVAAKQGSDGVNANAEPPPDEEPPPDGPDSADEEPAPSEDAPSPASAEDEQTKPDEQAKPDEQTKEAPAKKGCHAGAGAPGPATLVLLLGGVLLRRRRAIGRT